MEEKREETKDHRYLSQSKINQVTATMCTACNSFFRGKKC